MTLRHALAILWLLAFSAAVLAGVACAFRLGWAWGATAQWLAVLGAFVLAREIDGPESDATPIVVLFFVVLADSLACGVAAVLATAIGACRYLASDWPPREVVSGLAILAGGAILAVAAIYLVGRLTVWSARVLGGRGACDGK